MTKYNIPLIFLCLIASLSGYSQQEWEYHPNIACLTFGSDTLRNVTATDKELHIGENQSYKTPLLGLGLSVRDGYQIVSVGKRAFMNCHGIKVISLPTSIRMLEQEAFASCKKASIVIMLSTTPPQCDTSTFSHTPIDLCIVPKYYIKVYQNPMVFRPSSRKWAYVDNVTVGVLGTINAAVNSPTTDSVPKLDKYPSFPGGQQELEAFLRENVHYPEKAETMEIEGTVHISFVVDKSGSLSDFVVIKSVSKEVDNECLRVMTLMPKWEPGILKGEPVSVQSILPFVFRLE